MADRDVQLLCCLPRGKSPGIRAIHGEFYPAKRALGLKTTESMQSCCISGLRMIGVGNDMVHSVEHWAFPKASERRLMYSGQSHLWIS
jgi:hypothetical protein